MDNQQLIDDLITKSRAALKVLENYTQEQVDALVKAICIAVRDNAELLAKEAITETGLGRYEDKVEKNFGTPAALWYSLKDKKSVGIIKREPERGLVYIAKPKGIIVSVAPTTNPTITVLSNSVFAVKGRNTMIVAPHPRAKKTTAHTIELINAALKKLGAPDHILQITAEPSIELTQALMKAGDIIVATGGMAMVQAAYSSGRPAYGVGSGNVQTLIDRNVDYNTAAGQIIFGRAFDNGLICAANQSAIMPVECKDEIVKAFETNGAYYSEDPKIIAKFTNALFIDGKANTKATGQTAKFIAEMAGVKIPEGTKCILLKGKQAGREE
jgi:succinate-semialdehyde dehydrogenase